MDTRGNALAGGCLGVLLVILEIPAALLLAALLGLRAMARVNEYSDSGARTMDWVPVFWLGGFTLALLALAVILLRSQHPFAGSLQLLFAAIALFVTVAAWHDAHTLAHPSPLPPCPTRAGVPCAPDTRPPPSPSTSYDPGRTGHQCRSGGDSDECADSGR